MAGILTSQNRNDKQVPILQRSLECWVEIFGSQVVMPSERIQGPGHLLIHLTNISRCLSRPYIPPIPTVGDFFPGAGSIAAVEENGQTDECQIRRGGGRETVERWVGFTDVVREDLGVTTMG